MEFGKFNWNRFIEALKIYKDMHGNIDVPLDYVRKFVAPHNVYLILCKVIDEDKIYSASSEDEMLKYPADLEDFKLGIATLPSYCFK